MQVSFFRDGFQSESNLLVAISDEHSVVRFSAAIVQYRYLVLSAGEEQCHSSVKQKLWPNRKTGIRMKISPFTQEISFVSHRTRILPTSNSDTIAMFSDFELQRSSLSAFSRLAAAAFRIIGRPAQ